MSVYSAAIGFEDFPVCDFVSGKGFGRLFDAAFVNGFFGNGFDYFGATGLSPTRHRARDNG